MSEAPEKIWIDEFGGRCFGAGSNATQYTRTDTIPSQDSLIRAALDAATEKLGDMLYLLSIGSPGDGPFTLQDRTRDEVIDQSVKAIRALKTNPQALAAIKAKAVEGRDE